MGVDVAADRLRSITLCFSGSVVESEEEVNYLPFFKELRNTMTKRFGKPYKEDDSAALWVDGITHVLLSYEGVARSCANAYYSGKFDLTKEKHPQYYAYYLIEFTDYSFESGNLRESAVEEASFALDTTRP